MAEATQLNKLFSDTILKADQKTQEEAKAKAEEKAKAQLERQQLFNFTGIDNQNVLWSDDGRQIIDNKMEAVGGGIQALFAPLKIVTNLAGGILGGLFGALSPALGALGNILGGNRQMVAGNAASNQPQAQRTAGNTSQVPSATQTANGKKPATPTPSTPSSGTPSASTPEQTSSNKKIFDAEKSANYKAATVGGNSSLITFGAEKTSSTVRAMVEEYNEANDAYNKIDAEYVTALEKYMEEAAKNNNNSVNVDLVKYQTQTELAKFYAADAADLRKDIAAQKELSGTYTDPKDASKKTSVNNTIARLEKQLKEAEKNQKAAELNAAKHETKAKKVTNPNDITKAKAKLMAAKAKLYAAKDQRNNKKADVEEAVRSAVGANKNEDVKKAAKTFADRAQGKLKLMSEETAGETAFLDEAEKTAAWRIEEKAARDKKVIAGEIVLAKNGKTPLAEKPAPEGISQADWEHAIAVESAKTPAKQQIAEAKKEAKTADKRIEEKAVKSAKAPAEQPEAKNKISSKQLSEADKAKLAKAYPEVKNRVFTDEQIATLNANKELLNSRKYALRILYPTVCDGLYTQDQINSLTSDKASVKAAKAAAGNVAVVISLRRTQSSLQAEANKLKEKLKESMTDAQIENTPNYKKLKERIYIAKEELKAQRTKYCDNVQIANNNQKIEKQIETTNATLTRFNILLKKYQDALAKQEKEVQNCSDARLSQVKKNLLDENNGTEGSNTYKRNREMLQFVQGRINNINMKIAKLKASIKEPQK